MAQGGKSKRNMLKEATGVDAGFSSSPFKDGKPFSWPTSRTTTSADAPPPSVGPKFKCGKGG